jgi:putative SOS response-associated peptidase YedK
MCTNYRPTSRDLIQDMFQVGLFEGPDWPEETWKDYQAPIIRFNAEGKLECVSASYGLVPRKQIPPGVKPWDTMNARAETVAQLKSYAKCWREGQLCLVPMTGFFEPNYASGAAQRWQVGMADDQPFAVAGIWREWPGDEGPSYSFTQLTINADDHPLMSRFHKPGEEKRSLIVIAADEYDDWLRCRDPERARSYFQAYSAGLMKAWADPLPPRKKKVAQEDLRQINLF